jgi:ABC-type glycerol-3-phosphate transport system substrate-binding protein
MATDPETNRKLPLNRRDAVRAIALGAAGVTLAACGGGTTPSTEAPTAAAGAATAAPAGEAPTAAAGAEAPTAAAGAEAPTAAAEAPTAALAPGEPTPEPTPVLNNIGSGSKTVVFWHGLGGADGATMQEMLKTYAASKGDRTVRSETYDWGVFYQKLPTSIVAKSPPNLAIMHSWAIQQFAAQGLLQPADDIFFSTGLVPKDDFAPNLIETITIDGKTMAVPFDNHGWGLYYNTKLIQDAGLDPNNLPKNGDEFIQWALKLTTDENGKHPDESGFNPDKVKVWAIHNTWQKFTMPSTMWQFGGGIISDDGKKSMFDSEGTIAAFQYWYDLMYKHFVCPPAVPGAVGGGDLMKTNSLAFWWDGSWSLNFFKDNPDVAAVTKATRLNSLAPDGKQVAKMASHMLVVPVGVEGEQLELAKDLIKWLSDNGKTWANSGQVPARLTVQKDPDVQSIWSVKAFAEEFTSIGKTDVAHQSATEIVTTWEAAASGVLAKVTPIKDGLTEASKAIQAILDRG